MNRKGFYFSFDAVLALTVMSGLLVLVAQSTGIASNPLQAESLEYSQIADIGQDSLQVASQETFEDGFNDSFQEELLEETAMNEEDLERDIIDGITFMWAARNFTHAEKAAQYYFGSKIGEEHEYKIRIAEENETSIHSTSEMPQNPRIAASATRLVSGHRIDRPSEGFQSRARAVESTTNQTKIVDVPMLGSGGYTNTLEIDRDFHIPGKKIQEATAYISMQWGESNFNSADIVLNGADIMGEDDLDYLEQEGSAHYGFGEVDVTDEVEEGWNEFGIDFPNQDASNDYHAHVQPGKRIEVVYTEDDEKTEIKDWEYLTQVHGQASNPNQKGGVWYNQPVQVPEDTGIEEAVLELDIRDLEDHREDDLQVFVNDNLVHEESAPVEENVVIDFKEYLDQGTNVVSIYGNVDLQDGEIVDFTHEGSVGNGPVIYSDPEQEEGSRILVDYEMGADQLEFGLIDITWTEEIGGDIDVPVEEPSNPVTFEETFDEDYEIINTYLNLAQMNSIDINHEAGIGGRETVYQSPRNYSTPSRIETGEELVKGGKTTEYGFQDSCYDGIQRDYCWLLPESGLEIELGIPSQVGYGDLFETEEEALEDAEDRLDEQLGQFAEATEIEDDSISTGDQPYIWGPASVSVVVWNE